MMHLTAVEHQAISVTTEGDDSSLSAAEADVLLLLNHSRPGFCDRRYRSVRLAQYCGVVNLGRRVLEVVPKAGSDHDADIPAGRGVLLRLLHASRVHNGFRAVPAAQNLERLPLLEIFVAVFMDEVSTIVRGGLLRQYREREDDLRVVRGRIVTHRQFSVLFNRVDIVASRYDDHTADNVWNRSVKAALRAVRPWIVSGHLQRRWVELVAAMEDVSNVHITLTDVQRLTSDRQAARYTVVMNWVRWILALLSPTMRAGQESGPAFLFDMNVVFENAVANIFRRHFAEVHPVHTISAPGAGRHLARLRGSSGRRAFVLKPDVVVRQGKTIRLIADAKWKNLQISHSGALKPTRADIYQMHAYASAFEVEQLMLVYPAHRGVRGRDATTFELPHSRGRRPVVHIACVDVEKDGLPFTDGERVLCGDTMDP